jgi:enoyl-CoA hydratase/carnithine racemase
VRTIDLGSKYLDVTVADRVLRVRLNRPEKRNATTQDMYRGLKRAAIVADGDPELDALLLTGTDEWFGAGGDMSGEAEDPAGLAAELDPTDHFPFRQFEQCRKVIVAAVNGLCHAGGLDLVLHSDVSLASERATFRAPELLRGAPDPWIAARLAQHVGLAQARWLLFTCAEIDAREAARIGLVGEVVAHQRLAERVEWVLEQVRATAPRARAMLKDDLVRRLPVPDVGMFRRAIMSPEMVEGMLAFLERRRPRW